MISTELAKAITDAETKHGYPMMTYTQNDQGNLVPITDVSVTIMRDEMDVPILVVRRVIE